MHLLTQNKGICDKETSLWHKQDQLQNNLIGLDIPQALEKEAFSIFEIIPTITLPSKII